MSKAKKKPTPESTITPPQRERSDVQPEFTGRERTEGPVNPDSPRAGKPHGTSEKANRPRDEKRRFNDPQEFEHFDDDETEFDSRPM